MDHILLGCVFSREVWALALRDWRLANFFQVVEENAMVWWSAARKRLPKELRRGFDSFFLLLGWLHWKRRNARTFNQEGLCAPLLVKRLREESDLWVAAGNKHRETKEEDQAGQHSKTGGTEGGDISGGALQS